MELKGARSRRYARRSLLWEVSSAHRVRQCGRVRRQDTGMVGVRVGPGGAGFSGLVTCGSPWVDPVCNAKIMARRALELGLVTAGHLSQGGSALFGTLTIRHHAHQSLTGLWDAVVSLWRSVTKGEPWKRLSGRVGLSGYVRVVEVTDGPNGWHVHLHVLWLVRPGTTLAEVEAFRAGLTARWVRTAARHGQSAVPWAQDLRVIDNPADVCQYLTKTDDPRSIGLELTQTQSKTARTAIGTHPVWDHLSAVQDQGDADALDRWHVWERESKGRRQMTMSRGLRQRFGLGEEQSDEDIAAADVGDQDLVLITDGGWRTVLGWPAHQHAILSAAEVSPAALRFYLDHEGIEYREVGA